MNLKFKPFSKKLSRVSTSPDWQKQCRQKGFSLTELLVTIAVFLMLSTMVLANYRAFNRNIAIEAQAHEVASKVREAQLAGISVQSQNGVYPGYGVFADMAATNSYVFFVDTVVPLNRLYNGVAESVETITLKQGARIQSICGSLTGGACTAPLNRVHVTFLRPNPEATILGFPIAGGGPISYASADIVFVSPAGQTKTMRVWITGQLEVI